MLSEGVNERSKDLRPETKRAGEHPGSTSEGLTSSLNVRRLSLGAHLPVRLLRSSSPKVPEKLTLRQRVRAGLGAVAQSIPASVALPRNVENGILRRERHLYGNTVCP